jgi:hypothetical protein
MLTKFKNLRIIIHVESATNKILTIKEKQCKHLKLGKHQIPQLQDIQVTSKTNQTLTK